MDGTDEEGKMVITLVRLGMGRERWSLMNRLRFHGDGETELMAP